MESGEAVQVPPAEKPQLKFLDLPFPTEPAPIKILQPVDDDHTFLLNVDALERILKNPKYADKKVCVVGIAGKFRKGKSFLLNFFLRYLNYLDSESDPNHEHWLDREPALEGFSWRGGGERDTNGLLWWSQPFIVKNKKNESIVVLLMDTQGAFDQQSTVKDCATIFALSTMVSSIQIYNLQNNIHEDDLGNLQLFTEYGKLALDDNTNKPFQTLVFLVRDWGSPYDKSYGFDGGHKLLEHRLEISERQPTELQQIRTHIRDSFEELQCFLMPHPGHDVAESPPGFSGSVELIRDEFKKQLQTLIPRLLDPEKLTPKSINGEAVTCEELYVYFREYANIFSGEDLPSPTSIFLTTVEANNLAATTNAKGLYDREMQAVCGGDCPYISTNELESVHLRCRNEAIRSFKNAKKMGGPKLALQYMEKLEEDITVSYENFAKSNASKNLFKSMRTPAVLVTFIVLNYVVQELLQLFGLNAIATIFSMLLTLVIVSLGTWTYSRYSGNLRDIAHGIDAAVAWMWEHYMSPSWGNTVVVANQLARAR